MLQIVLVYFLISSGIIVFSFLISAYFFAGNSFFKKVVDTILLLSWLIALIAAVFIVSKNIAVGLQDIRNTQLVNQKIQFIWWVNLKINRYCELKYEKTDNSPDNYHEITIEMKRFCELLRSWKLADAVQLEDPSVFREKLKDGNWKFNNAILDDVRWMEAELSDIEEFQGEINGFEKELEKFDYLYFIQLLSAFLLPLFMGAKLVFIWEDESQGFSNRCRLFGWDVRNRFLTFISNNTKKK